MSDGVGSAAAVPQLTCRWCGSVDDGSAPLCPSCGQASSPQPLVPVQPTETPIKPATAGAPTTAPAALPAGAPVIPPQPPSAFDAPPAARTSAAGTWYQRTSACGGSGADVGAPAASFGARLAARCIDAVILLVIGLVPVLVVLRVVVVRYTNVFSSGDRVIAALPAGLLAALLVLEAVPLIGYLIYRLTSDAGAGRSVGRAAMGIRLVNAAGSADRVGFGRALGRLIVSGVTDGLFFLGSLSMLWNTEGRTWADLASGTRVVRDRTPRQGPGRALTAALAAVAVVTAGAASAGVQARDAFDRQLTAAAFSAGGRGTIGTDSGSGGTDTTPSTDPSTGTDSTGGTASGTTDSSGTTSYPSMTPSIGPSTSDSSPAAAAAAQTVTVNGGGSQVELRQGPGSSEYQTVGQLGDQSRVTVSCGVYGGNVNGNSLWGYTGQGWVSDALVTGIDVSTLPACAGTIFNPVPAAISPSATTGPFPTFTSGDSPVYIANDGVSATGSLPNGTLVTLVCSSSGPYESAPDGYGGNTSWNKITAGTTSGWFPDAWTNNHADTSQAPSC